MPWRGLEPRRLAAPPPQDGVSTNFTTRALRSCNYGSAFSCELLEDQYGTSCRHPIRIAFDCELSNTGATGLEPATSRVTVECSNQTELRPQHQQRTFSYWKPWSLPQPLTIARRGIEPLSAP